MEQRTNEDNLEQEQQQQQQPRVSPPEPPAEHCPRCNSFDIKFCYDNNSSLSQPRYFCKTCQRYWTHGGTFRNIPIGSGSRRGKRARTSDASSSLGNDLARTTRPFSFAVSPPQNGDILPGQLSRAFPPLPAMSSMVNTFQGGGATFYSSEMETFPRAINQGAAVKVREKSGDAYLGADLARLRGLALGHLQPQVPCQSQMQNNLFPSQDSMILPRTTISWSQSLININTWNSLGGSPYIWSDGQASSSSNPSQWTTDKHRGFHPFEP